MNNSKLQGSLLGKLWETMKDCKPLRLKCLKCFAQESMLVESNTLENAFWGLK